MSKTQIESVLGSLRRFDHKKARELAEVRENIKEEARQLDFLSRELPKPDRKLLSRNILAADGSCFCDRLESLSINIATATVYSSAGLAEYNLTDIEPTASYEATLANSLTMKALEYNVLDEVIQNHSDERKIDLVLVDGALSFPDEALGMHTDRTPWIAKAYEKYVEAGEALFTLCFGENIPIVGIAKRTTSSKYMIALHNAIGNYVADKEEVSQNVLSAFDKQLKKWKNEYAYISELFMISQLFGQSSEGRTIYTEITKGLRAQPPIQDLRNNILGSYIRFEADAAIFFLEVPAGFKERLQEILQLLVTSAHYSLKRGYPMPLFSVHKRVELKRKKARQIARVAKRLLRKHGIDTNPIFHNIL